MNDYTTREYRGVRIRTVNLCIILVSCILFMLTCFVNKAVKDQYTKVTANTYIYIEIENQAYIVQNAANYLTSQVRLFVENMDIQYVENYFEEVNVNQSREKALATLSEYNSYRGLTSSLSSAVQRSNDLMKREIYAMKLIAEANGYGDEQIPAEIAAVELEEEDLGLSAEEMIEKARDMVFSESYESVKHEITVHLSVFTAGVLKEIEKEHEDGLSTFQRMLNMEWFLLVAMIIILVVIAAVVAFFMIRPLRIWEKNIEAHDMLKPVGAYEYKHLAEVYNHIYSQNEIRAFNEAMLQHKVDHDPLTGIWNRNVFQQLDVLLEDNVQPFALLHIDVDHFKEINDTYGHEAGDRVLKKIARYLEDNLRANDYIFRIGGDEFAGVVMDIKMEQVHVIEEKISNINSRLKEPQDDVPSTSISVGCAFSDGEYHEELYIQADKALYQVKERGRCGFEFYRE